MSTLIQLANQKIYSIPWFSHLVIFLFQVGPCRLINVKKIKQWIRFSQWNFLNSDRVTWGIWNKLSLWIYTWWFVSCCRTAGLPTKVIIQVSKFFLALTVTHLRMKDLSIQTLMTTTQPRPWTMTTAWRCKMDFWGLQLCHCALTMDLIITERGKGSSENVAATSLYQNKES